VQNRGCALKYASDELKDNYDIVLAAVQENNFALQYASDELNDNYNKAVQTVRTVLDPSASTSETWHRSLWQILVDLDEKIRLTQIKSEPPLLDTLLEYSQLEQSLESVGEAIYLLPLVIAKKDILFK